MGARHQMFDVIRPLCSGVSPRGDFPRPGCTVPEFVPRAGRGLWPCLVYLVAWRGRRYLISAAPGTGATTLAMEWSLRTKEHSDYRTPFHVSEESGIRKTKIQGASGSAGITIFVQVRIVVRVLTP